MARDVTGFRGVGARRRPRPPRRFSAGFSGLRDCCGGKRGRGFFFRGGQRIVIFGMNDWFPYSADLRYALFSERNFIWGMVILPTISSVLEY